MVLVEGGAPFLGLKTLPFPFPFAVAHLPSGPTILFPVNLLLSWLYLLGGGGALPSHYLWHASLARCSQLPHP